MMLSVSIVNSWTLQTRIATKFLAHPGKAVLN
jgi:hypothetical protein